MSNRKSNVQHDSVSLNLANTMLNEAVFRPMLFSTPMVKALLDGTKTQTRRLVNPQPIVDIESGYVFDGNHKSMYKNDQFHQDWMIDFLKDHSKMNIGDAIWVRETFIPFHGGHCQYKATISRQNEMLNQDFGIKWKPSLFMPKSACRIWLKVTNVRVERLQDISKQDAINEGIIEKNGWFDNYTLGMKNYNYQWQNVNHGAGGWRHLQTKDPRLSYATLWDSINGHYSDFSWNKNPYVWVYDFEVSLDCPHGFI